MFMFNAPFVLQRPQHRLPNIKRAASQSAEAIELRIRLTRQQLEELTLRFHNWRGTPHYWVSQRRMETFLEFFCFVSLYVTLLISKVKISHNGH